MLLYCILAICVRYAVGQNETSVIPCDSDMLLPFDCEDNVSCINRYNFCDNVVQCPDGSDEIEFNDANASRGMRCQFRSYSGQLTGKFCHLPDRYKCDHELDCVGAGRDECGCRHSYQCDANECVLKIQFCDGYPDCQNGTDEKMYNRSSNVGFQCPVSKRHETRHCVLPPQNICDGDSDCDHGIDECFCSFNLGGSNGTFLSESYSNEACFRCLDGSLIIPGKQLCDGIIDCQDLSDECICSQKKDHEMPSICTAVCLGDDCACQGQVQCKDDKNATICLKYTSVCDSRMDCMNDIDEQYCRENDQNVLCSDGKQKIKKTRLCNGFRDCSDGSDEENCKLSFDYFCESRRQYFPFVSDWDNVTQTSAPEVRIPPSMVLSTANPLYSHRCDGESTCLSLDDECYAEGDVCENKTRPKYCERVFSFGAGLRCNNSRSSIIGRETCDGFPTCNDTHPAESIDELFCPNRFYCSDRGRTRLPIHIPLTSLCDQIQDCADQSDELGCSDSTHFYCSKSSFIRRSEVCDGTLDCASGLDECQGCTISPFSSDDKLISNRLLYGFLWLIGILSTIGNLSVIIHQLRNLTSPKETLGQIASTNRILVLNLALADLLVGVYLIALGIKDAVVSRYCLQDQEWRSSETCSGLGTMALLGTEASIFILLGMTAYRLFLVIRPFNKGNKRFILVALLLAWSVAFALSFAPHALSLRDYFTSCVWFKTNPFFGLVCRNDLMKFTSDLYLIYGAKGRFASLKGGVYNWDTMLAAVAEFNSSYKPQRYFGYYSAHGVCLPRLFPDTLRDQSWGYSLFLVVFNFCSFAFIVASYVAIYRLTTKRHSSLQSEKRADKRAKSMQRKITRIIASNFCCWMPICIMAFVKVSGVYISDVAYSFTAIVLLPINSAMNPFLYTDMVDVAWEKLRPAISRCRVGATAQIQGSNRRPTDLSSTRMSNAINTKTSPLKDGTIAEASI